MEENQNINNNNLELATQKKKLLAFVIDDLLITFITIMMLWDSISQSSGDIEATFLIMNQAYFQIIFLKFIYQTFFIWYYGATIGKIVFKIKVIDFNNLGRVNFTTAFIRSAIRIVSESILYLGFMISYYTESRQTLHDKVAKTLVVNV